MWLIQIPTLACQVEALRHVCGVEAATGRAQRDPKNGATSCRIRETLDWATQENVTERPLILAVILSLGLMDVECDEVVKLIVSHDDQAMRTTHHHKKASHKTCY